MTSDPFLVPIRGLGHSPGTQRDEHRQGPLGGEALSVAGSSVSRGATVSVSARLTVVDGGIVVDARVSGPWQGECRRCLRPLEGDLSTEVKELYRRRSPGEAAEADEETYPLGSEHLDLRLLARDALLLALPLAPLCRPDCAGLCPGCGADLNEGPCDCPPPATDPRWAALDVLRDPGAQRAPR